LPTPPQLTPPDRRRYFTSKAERYDEFLAAAESYAKYFEAKDHDWYFGKPYDASPGNPYFFTAFYNLTNILAVMKLPKGGVVLEVGSGPGWITEVLLALGYKVVALDPAASMHAVSRRRLSLAAKHWRLPEPLAVTYLTEPLEECSLPDGSVDGVLFYESLHHIVREEVGLAQSFRVLKPGGVLAVANEGVWAPGDAHMEAAIEKEMAEYGTLENPYTREYLDHLLARTGFENVVRYHAVNGFFPTDQGHRTIAEVADPPAAATNNLTARKPNPKVPRTTADPSAPASAAVVVRSATLGPDRVARVELIVTNTGPVVLLAHQPGDQSGFVTISLCRNPSGNMAEAGRIALPQSLEPGQSVALTLTCPLPAGQPADGWHVALVNEGHYWFHHRPGGAAVPVYFG
jgi:SAM-dependent methyltransferase